VLDSLLMIFTKLEDVDLSSASMESLRVLNMSYSNIRTLKFPKVTSNLQTIALRILHPNIRVQFFNVAQFNQRT
jgi:hypothetical protein